MGNAVQFFPRCATQPTLVALKKSSNYFLSQPIISIKTNVKNLKIPCWTIVTKVTIVSSVITNNMPLWAQLSSEKVTVTDDCERLTTRAIDES